MTRKLFAIGIGTGGLEQITLEAVRALEQVRVVFLLDKGSDKAALADVRRQLCERFAGPRCRLVEIEDAPRDARIAPYVERVEEWHDRRTAAYERALVEHLEPGAVGALLVWGDPSLYDSTLRILQALGRNEALALSYEVIPGISSPQVLAARHKINLNRIGGAVLITTGRRLRDGLPAGVDDIVVMLDGEATFLEIDEPGLEIYWGAYLGTEHELLVSGPLERCKHEIERTRRQARARHGWIMDTYLLRRAPGRRALGEVG